MNAFQHKKRTSITLQVLLSILFLPLLLKADGGYGVLGAVILVMMFLQLVGIYSTILFLWKGKRSPFLISMIIGGLTFLQTSQIVASDPDVYDHGDSQIALLPCMMLLSSSIKQCVSKSSSLLWNGLVTVFTLFFLFHLTYAFDSDFDDWMQYVCFGIYPVMSFSYTKSNLLSDNKNPTRQWLVRSILMSVLSYVLLDLYAWYTDSYLDTFLDNVIANLDDTFRGILASGVLAGAGSWTAVSVYKP
mgnify:CR=1 FL=1